nr:putative Diels-Alderase [Trichoderma sp. BCC7579]
MSLLGKRSVSLAAIIALFSAMAFAYLSQVPLGPPVDADFRFDHTWDDSCTVNKIGGFEVTEGPNQFSTSSTANINAVKITPAINKTNWEQWEFDAMSHSGLSFLLVTFSRDYAYHFFGKGTLRMEFYLTLPDGTVTQELDYAQESTIIECPGHISGIWNGTDVSYSFHVTKDMKHAKLYFDSWRIRGTYTLSATTPPYHADGSPYNPEAGNEKATEISPGLFYSLPTAGGEVEVEATLWGGKRLYVKGRGGSTRLWAHDSWLKVSERWLAIRAWAGPYTFTYWDVISRIDQGVKYVSAHLFYNDELLVGTQVGNVSDKADYVLKQAFHDGEIAGKYLDRNTGHHFEFNSPSQGKKWSFDMQHIVAQYQMGVGEGFGMSGFADRVTGGEVGGPQYEGRGQTEQTLFPEYIPDWIVWIMYGAGLLGTGKDLIFKFAAIILR